MSRPRWSLVLFAGAVAGGSIALGAARADSSATLVEATRASTGEKAAGDACPNGMALVEGEYCPHVEQRCLRWMDPPGQYHEYRCAEYARPARCLGEKVHKKFCIDVHERTEAESDMPLNHQSWTDAKGA